MSYPSWVAFSTVIRMHSSLREMTWPLGEANARYIKLIKDISQKTFDFSIPDTKGIWQFYLIQYSEWNLYNIWNRRSHVNLDPSNTTTQLQDICCWVNHPIKQSVITTHLCIMITVSSSSFFVLNKHTQTLTGHWVQHAIHGYKMRW